MEDYITPEQTLGDSVSRKPGKEPHGKNKEPHAHFHAALTGSVAEALS